jgi:hypothetical protein
MKKSGTSRSFMWPTACAEVGFYAIPTDDVEQTHRAGHDPEGIEGTLARIESDTVPVIEHLVRASFRWLSLARRLP